MPLNLPEKSDFFDFLWIGPKSINGKLSNDSCVLFHQGGKVGLCNADGKVLLPAEYRTIRYVGGHTAYLTSNDDAKLYDIKNHSISVCNKQFIPYYFSDGLAAFNVTKKTTEKGRKKFIRRMGYLNTKGKVAIPPKFGTARTFSKCKAFVIVLSDDGNTGRGAIINKSGEVVSPSHLFISSQCGDFIIGGKKGKNEKGLLDQNFKFILEPQYTQIQPIYDQTFGYLEKSYKNPKFFYAKKDDRQMVLSVSGRTLFELPKGSSLPVRMESGFIACHFLSPTKKNICRINARIKTKYFRPDGQEKYTPRKNINESSGRVSYRLIGPSLYLKTIKQEF